MDCEVGDLSRRAPVDILRLLRREVGYACPVDGCAEPYLEYHHFDPTWAERSHHDPEGMIALCPVHHRLAESFSKVQLRDLKLLYRAKPRLVERKIEWLRQDLLLVVGGNLYYQTPVVFQMNGRSVISVTKNDEGYLTLNASMISVSTNPRFEVREHFIHLPPSTDLEDFECIPSGRKLLAKYTNKDRLIVAFRDIESTDEYAKRYNRDANRDQIPMPITAVEVSFAVGETNISFDKNGTRLGGASISNSLFSNCGAGIVYNG